MDNEFLHQPFACGLKAAGLDLHSDSVLGGDDIRCS